MLFVTEEEYREYYGEWPTQSIEDADDGYGLDFDKQDEKVINIESKPKKYVYIYAETSTGRMYVAKKGTTFIPSAAKTFLKDEGERKAHFMSKK